MVVDKNNIKKEEGFFKKLITNNSGISSKNFFLVMVTLIGMVLLLVPAVTLIIEIIFMHTIATDLTGMAAYITAVGSLFLSAGITKAWSEKFEIKEEEIHDYETDMSQDEDEVDTLRLKSANNITKKVVKKRKFRFKENK